METNDGNNNRQGRSVEVTPFRLTLGALCMTIPLGPIVLVNFLDNMNKREKNMAELMEVVRTAVGIAIACSATDSGVGVVGGAAIYVMMGFAFNMWLQNEAIS